MINFFQSIKQQKIHVIIALVLAAVFVIVSCNKEQIIKNLDPQSNGSLSGNEVVASISGKVLHETGEPATNVQLSIGAYTSTTDNEGNFNFENITAPEKNAHLIAKLDGNFVGHRTLMLTQGVAEYTIIRLMKKEMCGSFDASKGGEINAMNGGKISFAAGSIMNASTKVKYDGNVQVYAKWIDPSGEFLSEFMPGCLRGISVGNTEEMLETYGMMAVELYDESNNLLQILNGKTAELKFPIPESMMLTAPSDIPMWYLDETTGLWKEQGSLVKKGTEYIGQASHFSFWNCDKPGYVAFTLTLQDSITAAPLVQKYVRITRLINNSSSTGYTNGNGFVTGQIPPNENLKLEVLHQCGGQTLVLKTVFFTTTNVAVNYGVLPVLVGNNLNATVTGIAVDANNVPLANTYVTAKVAAGNAVPIKLTTNAQGEFTYIVPICNPTLDISIVAYDNKAMLNSGVQNFTVQPGTQNIGSIQTNIVKSEFVRISTNNNGLVQDYYIIEPNANFNANFNNNLNKLSITCTSTFVGIDWYANFKINGPASVSGAHEYTYYYDKINAVILSSNNSPLVPNLPVYFSEYATVKGNFIACRSNLTFQNLPNISRVLDVRVRRDNY